jgi:ABC-2 type transport system permease protein
VPLFEIMPGSLDDRRTAIEAGDLTAIVVVPAGYGDSVAAAAAGGPPVTLTLYTDPSSQNTSQTIQQVVGQVVGGVNQTLSGRPPAVTVASQSIQTTNLSAAAFFVPSILAMALMQAGVFAAIPLVQQREKLILKRLSATPLPRWTLVGSNVLVRLGIAAVQTVLIVAIGMVMFDVQILGNPLVVAVIVALGAVTFISIGYVIASFARTEETANAVTSVVQFPLMFLSGIFFPLEFLPDALRTVAAAMPLTYLGDALRQVMVDGTPWMPLSVDLAVLGAWLAGGLLISARFFKWQ